MENSQILDIAELLWKVRQGEAPCAPLTETHSDLSIQEAYEVSKEILNRRLRHEDTKLVGKKIGLTAKAVQKQLGVDQPDYGYLLENMRIQDRGCLASGSLIQGKVEGEVAFVLKETLKGPGITNADVVRATDYVSVCIEVIDSRIADWKIRIQDTIADNASSAFFVVGDKKVKLSETDLVSAKMKLWLNDEIKSEGSGAACMDNPVNAVTWLANAMGELGVSLDAGDVILSGAYGPVVPISDGQECKVEIEGLGSVSFAYGDK